MPERDADRSPGRQARARSASDRRPTTRPRNLWTLRDLAQLGPQEVPRTMAQRACDKSSKVPPASDRDLSRQKARLGRPALLAALVLPYPELFFQALGSGALARIIHEPPLGCYSRV